MDDRLDPPTPAQCTALALVAIAELLAERLPAPGLLAELPDEDIRRVVITYDDDEPVTPIATIPMAYNDAAEFMSWIEAVIPGTVEVVTEAEWQRRRAAA